MIELLKKIDPHHHLWDLSLQKNNWLINNKKDSFLGDHSSICQDYLVSDYLEDAKQQRVVKSVAIQAGWDYNDPVGETRWLQSLADKHGFPHGIISYANFTSSNIEEILEEHSHYDNFRGIRQILNWNSNPYYSGCDQNYIENDKWQKNFSLLKKFGLSFDLQIYPIQMPAIVELASRYPDIQIIVEHAGMPLFREEGAFAYWKQQLTTMAELPNVMIKISGLGMFNHNWTVGSIKPIVQTVIDIFGIDRCMFASNYPVDKLYADYETVFNAFEQCVEDFSDVEIGKLFYGNALRIYRL